MRSPTTKSFESLQGRARRACARRVHRARGRAARLAEGRGAPDEPQLCCLSEGAVVETRPQLEIYADDVQCSHGAAIGRLDENALFYLRQRGLDRRRRARASHLGVRERDAATAAGRGAAKSRRPSGCAGALSAGATLEEVTREPASRESGACRNRERRRPRFDVEGVRPTSRSSTKKSTASRSCISTTRPRRRSRAA